MSQTFSLKMETTAASIFAETRQFLLEFIPDAFIFVFIFAIFLFFTWLAPLFWGLILRSFRLNFHIVRMSEYLLAAVILLSGLAFSFAAIGIDFGGVIVAYGFVGLTLSWGLSGVISNSAAAFWLQLDDAMQPGHYFRLGDAEGIIRDMSFKHIELLADNGDIVYVPNSLVLNNPVRISAARFDRRRTRDNAVSFASSSSSSSPSTTAAIVPLKFL